MKTSASLREEALRARRFAESCLDPKARANLIAYGAELDERANRMDAVASRIECFNAPHEIE